MINHAVIRTLGTSINRILRAISPSVLREALMRESHREVEPRPLSFSVPFLVWLRWLPLSDFSVTAGSIRCTSIQPTVSLTWV